LNTYLNNLDSPSQRCPTPPPASVPGTIPPNSRSTSRFGEGSTGYRRPYQRHINALNHDDENTTDLDPFVFEPYLDSIVHKLAGDGPELRHCMFCGPNELHMFDKCPILNDKRFSTTLAIRLGSTYQRTLKEAMQRQKESHNGDTPTTDHRRPPSRDPHAARIHQLYGTDNTQDTTSTTDTSTPTDPIPDFLQG
jgi:hypothetical protein